MAINPLELLKFRERYSLFKKDHPKVGSFVSAVSRDVRPGTILEMKVRTPEGEEKVTNIRLNENDIETLHMLHSLRKK